MVELVTKKEEEKSSCLYDIEENIIHQELMMAVNHKSGEKNYIIEKEIETNRKLRYSYENRIKRLKQESWSNIDFVAE